MGNFPFPFGYGGLGDVELSGQFPLGESGGQAFAADVLAKRVFCIHGVSSLRWDALTLPAGGGKVKALGQNQASTVGKVQCFQGVERLLQEGELGCILSFACGRVAFGTARKEPKGGIGGRPPIRHGAKGAPCS